MNVGPMLNGYAKGTLVGSGAVLWKGREMYATGEINEDQFMDYISQRWAFNPHRIPWTYANVSLALHLLDTAIQWELHPQ
jgi:hypothetical protein